MTIRTYRDLVVWQKAMELAKEVYFLAGRLPFEERFGLAGQLRRAAVSVPSNIAEGQARRHSGEFRQSLSMAIGSLAELDTQLRLADLLGFLGEGETNRALLLIDEIRRMAFTLARRLPDSRARRRLPLSNQVPSRHSPHTTDH